MRTILFAKVNSQKEDITTLLSGTQKQLALSDEQINEVDEHLVVRSLEEYEEKFGQGMAYDALSNNIQVTKSKTDMVMGFADRLEKYGKDRFEIWHTCNHGAVPDKILTLEEEKKIRKLQEIYIGIQAFFSQTASVQAVEQAQMLILNISLEELLENPLQMAKLEKYLDTVNHKQYREQKIDFAVLPEVEFLKKEKYIRERFKGTVGMEIESDTVSKEMADRLLSILGEHGVLLLYQFETGDITSARVFAQKGTSVYKQESVSYESHAYAEYISCCYPNLTAPYEGMYIGAAYVAAAMLSTKAEEGSTTVFPKELYPYSEQTRNDIAKERYGCMLVSETDKQGWGAIPVMTMLSARTCKSRQGRYIKIDKVRSRTDVS